MSQTLLDNLREYWLTCRPKTALIENQDTGEPLSEVTCACASSAGWRKSPTTPAATETAPSVGGRPRSDGLTGAPPTSGTLCCIKVSATFPISRSKLLTSSSKSISATLRERMHRISPYPVVRAPLGLRDDSPKGATSANALEKAMQVLINFYKIMYFCDKSDT
jgi:hypothetical protein